MNNRTQAAIARPSWSIDPNYVRFRGHVREGRRAVKRWKKDPACKLVKIVGAK